MTGTMVILHIFLLILSFGGVLMKLASAEKFLSLGFCLFYGGVILILFIYALGWQQVIKRLPLTTAYANRAITVIWGAVWGSLIFHEALSFRKIFALLLVVGGIVLFAFSDREDIAGRSKNRGV